MKFTHLAEKSLSGDALTHDEALAVLATPPEDILELLQAAFTVRQRYFGRKVYLHLLVNAKSGLCTEDCSYCSQSAVSQAGINRYRLLDDAELLLGAREARQARARRYCIVTSGLRAEPAEMDSLCRVARRIGEEVGIDVCVSAGLLEQQDAERLREAGVKRYNHNLNTSERFYSHICTTHTYHDRVNTLVHARRAGLELCCGALFGLGEDDSDRLELAMALREMRPDSIPVNFFHPIEGTLIEQTRGSALRENGLNPVKCLAVLCLMRLLNPTAELRVAGGREYHLRSLQPLAFYPANSIFVGGYLTVSGQPPGEAWRMVEDAGFEVVEE
ncbi:MAG: biotin synthase BioB [Dehalococcoidia bacterium]|nr:biotin synthase BioB [Dehalococcoidia bacterium]